MRKIKARSVSWKSQPLLLLDNTAQLNSNAVRKIDDIEKYAADMQEGKQAKLRAGNKYVCTIPSLSLYDP